MVLISEEEGLEKGLLRWNIWTPGSNQANVFVGLLDGPAAPRAGLCHLQLTPTEGEEEEEEAKKRRRQEHRRGSGEDSSFSSR